MYQWLNMAQYLCIRHVQGECLMYKSGISYVSMVEYGPIPCIRHVQRVCLMYKCV